MLDRWKPAVTVAAIIAQDGRFLLVEEETADGLRLNQPAGHLDSGESLQQAVIRETLEETAHDFVPNALIGIYLTRHRSVAENIDVTYLRVAFAGELGIQHSRALDHGIVRTLWMTHAEIVASQARHRSPMVLRSVEDYLSGQRMPLSCLITHDSVIDA